MQFLNQAHDWKTAFQQLREGHKAGNLRGLVVVDTVRFNQGLFTLIEIYPHNTEEVLRALEQTHSNNHDFETILLYGATVEAPKCPIPFLIMVTCKYGDRLCDGTIVTSLN